MSEYPLQVHATWWTVILHELHEGTRLCDLQELQVVYETRNSLHGGVLLQDVEVIVTSRNCVPTQLVSPSMLSAVHR